MPMILRPSWPNPIGIAERRPFRIERNGMPQRWSNGSLRIGTVLLHRDELDTSHCRIRFETREVVIMTDPRSLIIQPVDMCSGCVYGPSRSRTTVGDSDSLSMLSSDVEHLVRPGRGPRSQLKVDACGPRSQLKVDA